MVPTNSTVYAYYTISQNTSSTRTANFVKWLPPNVVQVTSGGAYPDTCGSTFDLSPNGRCTLQLAITGPVQSNDPNPHHHLFVCFPGGKSCSGTAFPLNVVSSAWQWTRNTINSDTAPIYFADIAALGDNVYAGGVENLVISTLNYFAGELWKLNAAPPLTWSEQYTEALAFSKVSSLIPNADSTSLYSSTGNNGFAGVDSFTPGEHAPVPLGDIKTLASAVQDLELGENNSLFAAGATTAFPPIGEVWQWNGSSWTATNFSDKQQGTAFWITYSPLSSSAPGLYVAATNLSGSNPVVFEHRSSNWFDAHLPLDRMSALQAMNTDVKGDLYVVGSLIHGSTAHGSILKNKGSGNWLTIPAPTDSRTLSTISFSTPASFIYVGGLNTDGIGAVWYSNNNGSTWVNTEL